MCSCTLRERGCQSLVLSTLGPANASPLLPEVRTVCVIPHARICTRGAPQGVSLPCLHLLAYNLTRLLMSEAAAVCDRELRSISFRHTVQLWSAWPQCGQQLDAQGWDYLLRAIAGRRVGNRPGRREPRAVKRRPKPRKLLDMPRSDARSCCYRFEH